MEENTPNDTTAEEAPKQKNFYRLHTFAEKGPNRREVRDHLMESAIFLPRRAGDRPLQKHEIDEYFAKQREARFPDQHAQIMTQKKRHAEKLVRRAQARGQQVVTVNTTTAKDPIVEMTATTA